MANGKKHAKFSSGALGVCPESTQPPGEGVDPSPKQVNHPSVAVGVTFLIKHERFEILVLACRSNGPRTRLAVEELAFTKWLLELIIKYLPTH